MKVILLKDSDLGSQDDILTVKDGYGQNFIINKGFGVLATEELLFERGKRVLELKEEENISLNNSNDLKIEIEETFLTIEREFTGNKMFGSIGNKDISEELKNINIDVNKRNIKLTKIYNVGSYVAIISCGNGISADLNIDVEAK